MPKFVFAYRQPRGYQPSAESAGTWRAWFDSMGGHLVQLGNPAIDRTTVGECRPEHTELGGFSVIEADDLESATVIAKGCPQLPRGGGVEIGLLGDVPPEAAVS
jgi:hypothetical protein